MSEHVVRAISQLSSALSQHLEPLRGDVRKSQNLLEKIVDYFKQVVKSIEEGFASLMQTQGEIVVLSKASELNTFRGLVQAQAALIEKKRENLAEDIEKVKSRYDALCRELSDNTQRAIQELDGHVIGLNKEFFTDSTGVAYQNSSVPTINAAETYFLDSTAFRNEEVEQSGIEACCRINDFLAQRAQFISTVAQYVLPKTVAEPTSIRIPVVVVGLSSGDVRTYLPGRMATSGQSWEHSVDPQFRTLSHGAQMHAWKLDRGVAYRELSAQERVRLHEELDAMFDRGVLRDTKWVSARNELHKLIDTITLRVGEG